MSTETQRQLETLTKETRKLVLNDRGMNADEVSTVVDKAAFEPCKPALPLSPLGVLTPMTLNSIYWPNG
jgi:hypothetical protein